MAIKKQFALFDVLAILAVLAAMLVANSDWIFTRPGLWDPWIYFGFFRHYDVPGYLAGRKEIARLPWILIGFLVNKTASPIAAAFILHAGAFALGCIYIYRTSSRLFGRAAAVIASLLYLTWQPIHGPGGWDFHDTLVPVVYLAAYNALISAASSKAGSFRNFFWFGTLCALAVHTNILIVFLFPALLVRAAHSVRSWMAEEKGMHAWFRASMTGTVLGAAWATVILGAVNVIFGRGFFFFDVLASRSMFLLGHLGVERQWWEPFSSFWWLTEEHMPMFGATLVLALVCTVISWKQWSSNILASSVACALLEYVLSFGVFAVAHAFGHPLLTPFYMLMPAALPMFIAIAAIISVTSKTPTNPLAVTGVVIFAALAFGLQFIGHFSMNPALFNWRPALWYNMPPFIVMLAGFLAAALIAKIPIPGRSTVALGCLTLALGQVNAIWPLNSNEWVSYDFRSRCPQNRALLSAIVQADAVLFPIVQSGKRVLPWFDKLSFVGPSNACTLATWQLGGPLFAMGYGASDLGSWDVEAAPKIPTAVVQSLDPHVDTVVVISNDNNYVAMILNRMRRSNRGWRESTSYTVDEDGMKFVLHLISSS